MEMTLSFEIGQQGPHRVNQTELGVRILQDKPISCEISLSKTKTDCDIICKHIVGHTPNTSNEIKQIYFAFEVENVEEFQ